MENIYKTSEVAKIIGIHPNTVRLYEDLELIPKANRLSNGYRISKYYNRYIKKLGDEWATFY